MAVTASSTSDFMVRQTRLYTVSRSQHFSLSFMLPLLVSVRAWMQVQRCAAVHGRVAGGRDAAGPASTSTQEAEGKNHLLHRQMRWHPAIQARTRR